MKTDVCDNCEDTENQTQLYTCVYCNDSDKCFCKVCLEDEHIYEHSSEIIDDLIKLKKFLEI